MLYVNNAHIVRHIYPVCMLHYLAFNVRKSRKTHTFGWYYALIIQFGMNVVCLKVYVCNMFVVCVQQV